MKNFNDNFNGISIRMVQEDNGAIWAVLRDIMEGMGRNHPQEIQDAKDLVREIHGEGCIKSFDVASNKKTKNKYANTSHQQLCIKEEAIYDVLLSFKPSARKIKNNPGIYEMWLSFRRFVTSLIKQYREEHYLGVFELYEKSNQLSEMDRVKKVEEKLDKDIPQNNYAIINKQVNQIVKEIHNLKDTITIDKLRNMGTKGVKYRQTRVDILKEYLDIYENKGSKADANMLIRYKYNLPQQGKGKKVFIETVA